MTRQPYYGIIGNGETCALISPKASIEWLCLPRFDGKIVYGRALDPNRGEALDFKIREKGKELLLQKATQRYISRTAVLETLLVYKGFSVKITDFMPFNEGSTFRTNQRMIFRVINVKNESRKRRSVEVKHYSGIVREKYSDVKEGILYSENNIFIGAVFYGPSTLRIDPRKEATFSMAIVYGTNKNETEKEMRKLKNKNPQIELQTCMGFWINWFDRGKKIKFDDKDFEAVYYRSLMTIKLLTYHKISSMIAAATASFPATPGGVENWDYRYTWLRDSYFAMRALLRSGHFDEVEKMLDFFYKLEGSNGHWKAPMYKIDGKELGKEIVIEELTGPGEEDHIRIGNAASKQLQLDSEGSILHATYLYYLFTGDIEFLDGKWPKIRSTANWIKRNHMRTEAGPWESRDKTEHYTYGKVVCFAGLDCASKIAKILGKKDEWKGAKEKLKKHILKNAWSEQRQSFLQTFEKDAPIDISVLAIEDYGIVRPDDPKMEKTVKLIEEKLLKDGGVMRYENAAMPFYLPTLWLASHYINSGNKKRAEQLIRLCINSSTDLYLVAEHFNPVHGIQYGNFPQSFNAAMFIEQIINLKERKNMLHMLNILGLDLDEFKGLFAFDKEKLVKASEGAGRLK